MMSQCQQNLLSFFPSFIAGRTQNCCSVLSCIALPANAHLDISSHDLYGEENAHALGYQLGSLISSVTDLKITHRYLEYRLVRFRGRSADVASWISYPILRQKWLDEFTIFLANLPMLNMESLCISGKLLSSFLFDDKAQLYTFHIEKYTHNCFKALLDSVSQSGLMTTATTGEAKWVDEATDGNSRQQNESRSYLEMVDMETPPWWGYVNYKRRIQRSELSDKEKLAGLHFPGASGPLHFTSLRSLKIDSYQSNLDKEAYFVDTTVLASVLRKSRGLPVHELSVKNSESLSLNAERDLAMIRKFVDSLDWCEGWPWPMSKDGGTMTRSANQLNRIWTCNTSDLYESGIELSVTAALS